MQRFKIFTSKLFSYFFLLLLLLTLLGSFVIEAAELSSVDEQKTDDTASVQHTIDSKDKTPVPTNNDETNKNNKKNNSVTTEHTVLIEVTSNKRKENIQNVAASVSAFTQENIENKKIEDVNSLSTYIPNYQTGVYNPGFVLHAIRGQSNITQASSPIGIYVDDVPLTASQNMSTNNPDLFALQRIEVLRCPQGNLYGLNSATGIINIITREPLNSWHGKAEITGGNYHLQRYNAYADGAIVKDKLYVAIGVVYKRQHAYLKEVKHSASPKLTIGYRAHASVFLYASISQGVQVFYSPVPDSYVYENAPKEQTAGVELEFIARPLLGLDLSLSTGYLYTQFLQHSQTSKNRKRLPFSPDFQIAIGLQYTSRIGVYLGGNVKATGLQFFADANLQRQNAYAILKTKKVI